MFSFCAERHKLYQKEFSNYLFAHCNAENDNFKAKKCLYNSDICNLWLFESSARSNQCFVIVSSLFNSPEILFFNENDGYIDYLKQFGNVYLVEWISVSKSLNLSDYAHCVAGSLDFIKNNTKTNINLIGHCIGGNIAIFSTFISNKAHSLTLLTTPWDYSHFTKPLFLAEQLQIKKAISGLKIVPKIYIQMLFFMLFPEHYQNKLSKYFALNTQEAKEKYLRVEKWLQSGIDIPSSLYEEILDSLITKNSLVNKNFYINDMKVSLEDIKLPSCIIFAKEDQIVPITSVSSLKKELQNSTFISVEGGHIAYLVNNDKQFKLEYAKWLRSFL